MDEKELREQEVINNQKEEKKENKRSKKRLFLLLLLLIVTGVMLSTSTYAWFTSNRTVTVEDINVNVAASGGIQVSVDGTSWKSIITNDDLKNANVTYSAATNQIPSVLKPVSTADLTHFYKASAQNKNGIAISYKNADDKIDRETLHGTVYLQCLNASCDVYFNKNELALGSDPQALAAMRLGMKITAREGSKTYIFRLDDLGSTGSAQSKQTVPENATVVSSVTANGQAEYRSDPATGLSDYMAESGSGEEDFSTGVSRLVRLEADEIASVEYWIYLEGCDEQCVNEVQNRNSEIRLAFAGVDAKE